MSYRSLLAGVALAAAAVATPALAAEPRSLTVSFADLDLTSAEGMARLNERIGAAARRVCRPFDTRDLKQVIAARSCRTAALARAASAAELAAARRGERLALLDRRG